MEYSSDCPAGDNEYAALPRTGRMLVALAAGCFAMAMAPLTSLSQRGDFSGMGFARSAQGEIPAADPRQRHDQLTPAMNAALESVAVRYRVAPDALRPVFQVIQAASQEVDPMLVVAVIGIESGFNPLAQSVMGAQGLMQVIPRFHRDKLPEGSSELAFLDPVSNVRVGIKVLQESIRRQGGVAEGLQYYAGASDDPEMAYSTRVLGEKQRLEQAAKSKRGAVAVR